MMLFILDLVACTTRLMSRQNSPLCLCPSESLAMSISYLIYKSVPQVAREILGIDKAETIEA